MNFYERSISDNATPSLGIVSMRGSAGGEEAHAQILTTDVMWSTPSHSYMHHHLPGLYIRTYLPQAR